MVKRVEAIYEGGTYELIRDSQTGMWTTEAEALKSELKSNSNIKYCPVMIRATDSAGNITTKTISDQVLGDNLLLSVREIDLFPMKFIIASPSGEEQGYADAEFDVDLGGENDFEMVIKFGAWEQEQCEWGGMIYIPGTEYGGVLEDRETSEKRGEIIWRGYTWRGILSQKIIYPPKNETHLTVTGEANKIIRNIIGKRLGDLFYVSDEDSGLWIENFQFDRYTTILEGLNKMLSTANGKLHIEYKRGDAAESGAVCVRATRINDWSEELILCGENSANIQTRVYKRGINHLVCAGEGEGTERLVIHLYVQKDGTIGETPYYTGLEEREALYSYTSQEDAKKLREDGTKRLRELMNYEKAEITIDNVDVEIGDIVGGRDYVTGMEIRRPVIGKIIKIKNGRATIDYKVKGEG